MKIINCRVNQIKNPLGFDFGQPRLSWQIAELIAQEIERFTTNRNHYSYSRMGVILCLLHIPHKFKHRYFCSQFVTEMLAHAEAVDLKKNESLYLPEHLLKGIRYLFPQIIEYDVL